MSFRKNVLLGILCLTVGVSRLAFADDDPPKLISLGLSAATAMASEKDVVKGLKTAAKDEYTSWMWEAIGGTEKFIFQNSEADLPGVKDKINNIVSVVGQIEKFSIAMTEGKYDDAAFAAIDQVVGTVNHPLVSLTWEMAKLTYESHKLVQESTAALKVETLYGMMNNDRRLMGTVDPKSDAPPVIPESAASADYFFNKYVMTNDAARSALQAYVTTVLGEEWPEQSWSAWIGSFSATGSGVDTAKSAELEMLDGEWRNKGRTWIISVIKEVNKMAKVAWAEARLRQQMVEFKKFADRVGHFYNGDFAQMLKEFQDVKNIQRDIPNYAGYLAKSQSDRQSISSKLGSLKPKDIGTVGSLRVPAEEWYYKCLGYASRADLVKEKGLASSFKQEQSQWQALLDKLKQFMDAQKGEVVQDAKAEITTEIMAQGSSDFYSQMAPYAKKYFDEITQAYELKELEWIFQVDTLTASSGQVYSIPADTDRVADMALAACNLGKVSDAVQIRQAWESAARKHLDEWRSKKAELLTNVPELASFKQDAAAAQAGIDAGYKELEAFSQARVAMSNSLPNCPDEKDIVRCNQIFHANTLKMQAFDAGVRPIKARLEKFQMDAAKASNGWNAAAAKTKETVGRLFVMADKVYADNLAKPAEVTGVFEALVKARREQYLKLNEMIDYINKTIPQDIEGMIAELQESFKKQGELAHTYITPMRENNPNPLYAGGTLSSLASHLMLNAGASPSAVLEETAWYEKTFKTWEQAATLWKSKPEIDEGDIMQIQVLMGLDYDLGKEVERVNKMVAAAALAPSRIKSILDRKLSLAETDHDNRSKDSYWLIEKARVIDRYFRSQFDKKKLYIGSEGLKVVIPGTIEDGMLKANEPYPHFMIDKELTNFTNELVNAYKTSPAAPIMQQYLPDHHDALIRVLSLDGVKPARGENFFLRNQVVYGDDMDKAASMLSKMTPQSADFEKNMDQVAVYLPLMLQITTDKEISYHEGQARVYGLSLAEYEKKVLRRSLSDKIYALRPIDLKSEGLDQFELGRKYMALKVKVEKLVDERRGMAVLAQQQAAEASTREELRRREEESARKALDESNKMLNAMDPFQQSGLYGYAVDAPRLNTRAMNVASGDVVLSKKDLIGGEITVEGRLFSIDKAKTMLLSEDGGRTWQEIGLSQNVNVRVKPLADKSYDFVLRIKTTDGREPQVRIFPNVNSIVYRDVDFEQVAAQTIKTLADAYEQSNAALFSDHVSRDYLGNKASLEEGIRFDFDMFTNIRLTIYINRIQQRADMFLVETKWDKTQTPRKTGQEQRTSGKTTFTLVLEDGKMKIKNLRGDLIYATLSPEIAQASGKTTRVVEDIRTARDARNPTQPGAAATEDAGGLTTSSSQDEAASIRVTSPNGGESWARGSSQSITWTSSGVTAVHIEYKEGAMWFDVVASTPAAAGSYTWNINGLLPPIPACEVRITAVEDASVTDTSDATFSVL